MKKLLLILVAILVYFCIAPSACFAASLDFAPMYIGSYYYWSSTFGSVSVSTESNISDLDENTNTRLMYNDDLYVMYDNATLYANGIYWHYAGDPDNSIEWKARLLGFFATMEYGAPIKRTEQEIDDARLAAYPVYKDYITAINDREEDILSGEMVLFSVSETGRYYITLSDSMGLVIMVK